MEVTKGFFTVILDFGSLTFPGPDRFIEVRVKKQNQTVYFIQTPRHWITSVPYAIRSLGAGAADDAANLGGVPASEYVHITDARLSDDRNPLPGSTHYLQNTSTQQVGSFNINGSGNVGGTLSAGLVRAQSQFEIGLVGVLRGNGAFNDGVNFWTLTNTFVGEATGLSTTPDPIPNSVVGGKAHPRPRCAVSWPFGRSS